MIKLTADIQANFQRFIEDIQESGLVWGLQSDEGWVVVESTEYEDSEVIPFWSDESFAKVHCKDEWANFSPVSMDIDTFVDEWLTGMAEDDILIGPNWNEDLDGIEVEPDEIIERLNAAPDAANE